MSSVVDKGTTAVGPRVLGQTRWPALVGVLLLAAWLLFFELGRLSLSVDEYLNVQIDVLPLRGILAALQAGNDLHPPVTHWLSHAWLAVFGVSEWSVRAVWSLVGVVAVAATYQLGRRWGSRKLGAGAALLLATTPAFVQYTRFVKYYAFTLLLAVVLMLVFTRLARRPTLPRLALYTALLVVFLYTDYFGILICGLWQDLFLLLRARRALRPVLAAQAVAGVLWLPWVSFALHQGSSVLGMTEADLGAGWRAMAIKAAYAFYSFTLGETLLPWRPLAIVGGLAAGLALLGGAWVLWRRAPRAGAWSGSLALLSIGLLAVLCSTVIVGVPFISFANHTLFTLPFFCLWLASGAALPGRWLRSGVLAGLLLAHGAGLLNYYAGRDYLNPIYAVPTREVMAGLAQRAGASDVVVAEHDTAIGFYAARTSGWQAAVVPPDVARETIGAQQPARVWLFEFGRDRTRSDDIAQLRAWLLENGYQAGESEGYAAQDPLYRALKTRLLGRAAYEFKLTLTPYTHPP
jgi:hypothetical protein